MVQVLSQIGLRSEVDHITFLACAREVESWGPIIAASPEGEQARESFAVARELVQELSSNAELQSTEVFRALRDISFVPAIKVHFGLAP